MSFNLIGEKFGKLEVVARAGSIHRASGSVAAIWQCKCDCGNRTTVLGSSLRTGKTKSCGCLRPRNYLLPGEAVAHILFSGRKKAAAKRRVPWGIPDALFYALIKRNCACCGSPPSKVKTVRGCKGHLVCNDIGLVDETKGYTEDNVITCCPPCKAMKGFLSMERFLGQAEKITRHAKVTHFGRSHGVKQL